MTPLTSLSFKPVLLLREFNTSAWSPGEGERPDDVERQRKDGEKSGRCDGKKERGRLKQRQARDVIREGGISHEADSEVALTAEEIEQFEELMAKSDGAFFFFSFPGTK